MKNNQQWLTRALALLVLTLAGMTETASAAGGYTYKLVWPTNAAQTDHLCDYAINDLNQVAYMTYQSVVGPSSTTNQIFVHFWDPNTTGAPLDTVIYTAIDTVTNTGAT